MYVQQKRGQRKKKKDKRKEFDILLNTGPRKPLLPRYAPPTISLPTVAAAGLP